MTSGFFTKQVSVHSNPLFMGTKSSHLFMYFLKFKCNSNTLFEGVYIRVSLISMTHNINDTFMFMTGAIKCIICFFVM